MEIGGELRPQQAPMSAPSAGEKAPGDATCIVRVWLVVLWTHSDRPVPFECSCKCSLSTCLPASC